MKITKGNAGYLTSKKKRAILKTVLEFGIVLTLLILGIVETGDRMNYLTIIAVVGCLPASKSLVEVIMVLPHRSISKERADEIKEKTELLTVAYDLVLTSEKNIMPIEAIVISNNTICGYSSSTKMDFAFTMKHIKRMLASNKFENLTVKIFDNYTAFITRAEGMQNIAAVEKADTKEKEERIKRVLLSISL